MIEFIAGLLLGIFLTLIFWYLIEWRNAEDEFKE